MSRGINVKNIYEWGIPKIAQILPCTVKSSNRCLEMASRRNRELKEHWSWSRRDISREKGVHLFSQRHCTWTLFTSVWERELTRLLSFVGVELRCVRFEVFWYVSSGGNPVLWVFVPDRWSGKCLRFRKEIWSVCCCYGNRIKSRLQFLKE